MKQWFSKSMERPPIRILFFGVLIFTLVIAAFPVTTFLTSTLADAGLNAIQMENNLPGDPSWNDFASSLTPDQLSGYGSKISVNHSDAIDFFVTTTDPSFSIDIYRTGWYHGNGARKITSLGTFTGVHQAIPTPDPVTGMVSCNWTKTTTLTIPSDWVSGVYLARLNGSDGDKSFIFFVVRNDGGNEDLLFQTSVTTYQAYNKWGDTSLYNNVTDKSVFSGPHATKVSFDRPFNPGDSNGAGHYFFYEYKFVYWMESQGYNVAYTTDVDTDGNVSTLTNHKGFLSVGHDEYWSKGMRDTVQQAINAGVNVAFFGANAMYWQIRFEPDAAGNAKRVEVGYKDYATETLPPGPDPMWNVNNAIVTTNWRSNPVNNPENGIMGVMFENEVNQTYPFVVQDASNWVFAGTGFANGSSIPGIVGYEYDNVFNNGATPAGLAILGHSPVVDPNGANSYSAATLYTAPSGAHVFAAGTIQWSWGLANTQGNTYMNAGIQKATANILNTFINGLGPSVILTPNSLDFGNQNVGTSSATKTITVSNSGTAALNISSVMITGTNTSDFAQTNDCPASLAVNASCTISVIFTPASTGVKTASVTLTDNAANSPQTVSLGGTGGTAAPAVTLNPSSLSFGNQAVGSTSSAQTVTLTNSGASALTITSIAVNGTNAGDFAQNNNCPASLAANASCTISVTFTPTTSGNRSASLTFADNAGNSPQTVALSGTSNTSTIYLSDGFETGDLSKWTLPSGDSTGTRTVQSTVVNNGNNALQFNNASGQYAYVYTTLPSGPQAQTFTRFYFRYDSSVTSGTQLAIARNANGGNIWELDYNAARHGLDVYFWNATNGVLTISSPSNVLSPNTWYSIEVQDTESVNGQAQVWLNGTSIGTTTGDLSTANPYARLMLFDSSPGKMYFDDVQVASTYNGPATASPHVTFNPTSLSFGSQTVGTTSAVKTVTLTNTGTATLTVSSITLTGTDASDFAQTNDCPATLAVNASCTINVTFTPTVTGAKTAAITLTDNAANSPQTVPLSGTGATAAPAVTLNPSSLSFGNQAVGSSSSAQTVTLTNSGASALTITNIAINGTNAGDFAQTNNCPASLAANASCTISVTFTPTTSGNRSASLTFADNAADSPQTVALSGSSNASVTYLSDSFETGDLSKWTLPSGDSTGTRTVQSTVVNNGNNALQFNNASGQYAYVYTTLPSGPQTQTFTRFYLRYDSSVTSGTQLAIARNANGGNVWELDYNAARHGLDVYFWNATNGVLTISSPSNVLSPNTWYSIEVQDTESVNGQAQVWLNGTSIGTTTGDLSTANPYARLMLFDSSPGKMYLDDVQVASTYNGPATASPHVTFNPTSLSFGSQTVGTTSAAKPVTLTNTGTATLTLNTITFTQEDPSDFAQTNDCPATLAVNASCTINVTFTPTAAGGRDANLTVTDNATDSPQSVILSGTGVVAGPAVTLNPSSVSFSNQNVGSPSPAQTVTLTNSGTSSLTISNITLNGTNAGDFAQTNNCPATLAVNVSCTISISFAPTATGARTASLAVTDNAIDSPQSLTLSGTGVSSTIYFSDSFESGNLNQWTLPNGDSTGTIAAQSNVVHTGTYALAFTNTGGQYAYVYTVLPSGPQSQTFTKFSFYCGSNVTSGTQFAIARNNNGGNVWEVDYNANRHGLDIYFWNGANTIFIISTPSNVLNANTWYNIEIEDIQASNGQAQVWLNGTSVGTVNGDLSMANPYARLMFYDSAPGTISIDDVLVSNSH